MSNKKKSLTLSIIIPVYNEERYLEDCLISIKNQTEPPDEIIVVDNNSIDKSMSIAKKFGASVVKEPKQGIVFARNRGFDTAKGDIIGRIDADTVLPPGWVENIKRFYSDKADNYAWTGGGSYRNLRLKWLLSFMFSQVAFRFNRLLMGHYILWGSNMAMTRRQWQSVRSEVCTDTEIHEDLDLAIHLHNQGIRITYEAYEKVFVVLRWLHEPGKLKRNLMMWPNTLRLHNKKTWIFGWLGAWFFYSLRYLTIIISKSKIA